MTLEQWELVIGKSYINVRIIHLRMSQRSVTCGKFLRNLITNNDILGPFEKFMDLRLCAAVMQREAVTFMPSCSGGGNVVLA
jgi:hypothetical protein